MSRPPLWMRVKVQNEKSSFGLWLPLFLLLPLALVVLIILSPLIIIAILVLWPSGWGKRALQVLGVAWALLCSLHGLKVDVQGRRECVHVTVV
jgi:hypothetical protein